jgi:hypothetical protein
MKKTFILAVWFLSQLCFGQSSFNYAKDFKTILERSKDKTDAFYYDNLLARFNSNDLTLTSHEILALLIGYTGKPDFKPYKDISKERDIYDIIGNGKFEEGLREASKFLATHPLSVKVLFEKSYAFYKLGKRDSSDVYFSRGKRIFDAMEYSGDGKTTETPMFSLGPADGQDYIHRRLQSSIGIMGSGRDKNGNFLDMLDAEDKFGTTTKMYFIIEHAAKKMFDE